MVPGEVQQRGAPSPSPLRVAHACLTRRSSPGSLSAHFLQVTTSSEKSSLVAIHHAPSSLIISSLYFVSSGHLKTSAVGVFVDCLALPTKRRVLWFCPFINLTFQNSTKYIVTISECHKGWAIVLRQPNAAHAITSPGGVSRWYLAKKHSHTPPLCGPEGRE